MSEPLGGPEPCSEVVSPERVALRSQGYSIVRDVVPPEAIARLREVLQDHFRQGGRMQYGGVFQLRGLQAVPEVARDLLTAPVLAVLRRHVSGPLLLTGECDLMCNTTSAWHKDITADMGLGAEVFERPESGVYKMALYLQDQPAASPAAFRVRPGSQLCLDGVGLAERRLGTRAGDVVIFDVRLDHAGQPATPAERLLHRAARLVARPVGGDAEAWVTRLRRRLAGLRGRRPDRLAVFLTFGPDAPATRRYEAAGRHRHGAAPAPLPPEAAARLRAAGIGILTG